jgi:long-subunit acyl-CoA synthetase (AMP-forming)
VHPDRSDLLTECFSRCLHKINCHQDVKFERIQKAIIIDQELTLERDELTPSFKIIARNIEKNYKEYIDCMMQNNTDHLPGNAYAVEVCDCCDTNETDD